MFIFLSVCSLLVPLSMIILGYTWKNKPPKDRQGISGYQTTMSRMNDETWKYAHRCWGCIKTVPVPGKKHKLYKSSIDKSIHFVQRSLSSSTRVQRVTAQLNLSRE